MGRKSWGKPNFRDLTIEELANLLLLSYTDSRERQHAYLESLVGFASVADLEYMLSVGRNDEDARRLTQQRAAAIDETRFPGAQRVKQTVIDAVNYFTHQAIRGEFGPDNSRDGRSAVFLVHSHVIPRAISIFLENLLVDSEGNILNHDEAEERGAEYIRSKC